MFEVAEYRVKFYHARYEEPKKYTFLGPNVTVQGSTTCYIVADDKETVSAVTFCSADDQFERNEGRKRALERVLEKSHFNKAQRTKFWEAYFKKRGKVG